MDFNSSILTFGLIGGDKRLAYLGEYLARRGHFVKAFGFDKYPFTRIIQKCTLQKVAQKSDYLILPSPFSKDSHTLFTTYCYEPPFIEELTENIINKKIFCSSEDEFFPYEIKKNNTILNYNKDENFIKSCNEIVAQQGLLLALTNGGFLIKNSRSFVFGYDNLGQILADMLGNLGSVVMVCDSDITKLNLAKSKGFLVCEIENINNYMSAQFFFNTKKQTIIKDSYVDYLLKDSIVIDLIENGVDSNKLAQLNVPFYKVQNPINNYCFKSYAGALGEYIIKNI